MYRVLNIRAGRREPIDLPDGAGNREPIVEPVPKPGANEPPGTGFLKKKDPNESDEIPMRDPVTRRSH
jgi:hypothetical protein